MRMTRPHDDAQNLKGRAGPQKKVSGEGTGHAMAPPRQSKRARRAPERYSPAESTLEDDYGVDQHDDVPVEELSESDVTSVATSGSGEESDDGTDLSGFIVADDEDTEASAAEASDDSEEEYVSGDEDEDDDEDDGDEDEDDSCEDEDDDEDEEAVGGRSHATRNRATTEKSA